MNPNPLDCRRPRASVFAYKRCEECCGMLLKCVMSYWVAWLVPYRSGAYIDLEYGI